MPTPSRPEAATATEELLRDVLTLVHEATPLVDGVGPPIVTADDLSRIRDEVATVVVVGEKKRGKSALLNALVDVPDLLPVDADLATNVHIVVRNGPGRAARVFDDGHPEGRDIPVEAVAEFAALDPLTGRPVHDDVLHVEVAVPSSLLGHGIDLVDTPGVGGLRSGHGALTLAVLARADSLIFVVSAASEITRSEIAFLHEAARRVASVHFVLTQVDKHPGWERVLARNKALLAEHAPRFSRADWFVVSSRLKSRADRVRGEPERHDRLLAASGVPELVTALASGVAARAVRLRLATVLVVVTGALQAAAHREAGEIEALADPHGSQVVNRVRERMRALAGAELRWRKAVGERTQRLGRELDLALKRGLADLRDTMTEQIATGDRRTVDGLPDDLAAGVQALWCDLESAVTRGLAVLATEVATEFAAPVGPAPGPEMPLELVPAAAARTAGVDGVGGAFDRLLPSLGIGSVTATVGIHLLGPGMLLAPLSLGAGLVWLVAQRRGRREELLHARGDAQRYLNQVLNRVEIEVPPVLIAAVERTAADLQERLDAEVGRRRAILEGELVEAEALQRIDAAERARRQRAHRDRLDAVTALAARAVALRRALDSPA